MDGASADDTRLEAGSQGDDQTEAAPPADALEQFVLQAARSQAAERMEEDEDDTVDAEVQESFIARALAESRRMRGEASQSQKKRAELTASIAARHGQQSVQVLADAMVEHAAEALHPQEAEATGQGEVESMVESQAALASE
mmetsp:Transcript_76043/g.150672  ORF Transcript_76043/g.150672 Transcript_76043/m.150672 type:complete len:142 (-) Transcript_76043:132-557(-)